MSHFVTMVMLDGDSYRGDFTIDGIREIERLVGEALAPYDEEVAYHTNTTENAKWDWWRLGGFGNRLRATTGIRLVEGGRLIPGGTDDEYVVARLGDCDRDSEFAPYAVITPDGEWHAPGVVGWFGTSSEDDEEEERWAESFYEDFLGDADPDTVLALVDCHI